MDFVSSFFQNVKDKLSNPFFGTLIFILIFHHWQFWYALFNFDKGVNLEQKLNYLVYIANKEFSICSLICDILIATIFTIVGYGIVIGTRSLSLWIEFGLMPSITEKVIDKKVVLREDHIAVVNERDEYSEKYEEQRKNVRQLSKDYDLQTNQISEKDKIQLELNDQILELQKQVQVENDKNLKQAKKSKDILNDNINLTEEINILSNQKLVLEKQLYSATSDLEDFGSLFFDIQSDIYFDNIYKFPTPILIKASEIFKKNLWPEFMEVGKFITKSGTLDYSYFEKLNELGLVEHDASGNERFTVYGLIIYRYKNIFEDAQGFLMDYNH